MSVVLESGFSGLVYPMTHPRICWNSIARRAVVSTDSEAAGFEAVNAASPFTYSFWRPEVLPASLTLTLPSAEPVAYIAFADHDLGSVGASLDIEVFASGLWVSVVAGLQPASDADLVVLCAERNATAVRVTVSGAVPTIAVIAAGPVIEVPQMQYADVGTPVDLSGETEYRTTRTIGNAYVGRSVKRQRNINRFPIANVTEGWVRSVLAPFIADAVSYPYFLAERPQDYPDAVSYRWQMEDIRPERTGRADLMRVRL